MKEELKLAKQKMKIASRPYNTYGYYLAVPIIFIVVMILSIFGFNQRNLGSIVLVFTTFGVNNASNLSAVSKRKYVAPILLGVVYILSLVLLPVLLTDLSMRDVGDTYFLLMGLIVFPIQIVMIIFFLVSANDIRKAYPTMREDAKESRENFIRIKKMNKGKLK